MTIPQATRLPFTVHYRFEDRGRPEEDGSATVAEVEHAGVRYRVLARHERRAEDAEKFPAGAWYAKWSGPDGEHPLDAQPFEGGDDCWSQTELAIGSKHGWTVMRGAARREGGGS